MPGPGCLCEGRDSLESQNCGLDHAGRGERSLAWACGPGAAVPALASMAIFQTSLGFSPTGRGGRRGSTGPATRLQGVWRSRLALAPAVESVRDSSGAGLLSPVPALRLPLTGLG